MVSLRPQRGGSILERLYPRERGPERMPSSSKSTTTSTSTKSTATKTPQASRRATQVTSKPSTTGQSTAATSKPSATTRPAAPVAAAQRQTLTRRQARASQRAYERRRRAATNWSIVGVLVAIVVIAVLIIKQPWTGLFASHSSKTASSCPAPTATAIGPVPAITPPPSPPAVQGTSKTLGDGLQEIIVHPGCGAVVQAGQTVVVEYTGWVQSTGKLFDSSFQHQPTDCNGTVAGTCGFGLSQGSVIQGWVEGVAGMKIGESRRLVIPPALAYGTQGSPPSVPGNATLIFDITVVGVQ